MNRPSLLIIVVLTVPTLSWSMDNQHSVVVGNAGAPRSSGEVALVPLSIATNPELHRLPNSIETPRSFDRRSSFMLKNVLSEISDTAVAGQQDKKDLFDDSCMEKFSKYLKQNGKSQLDQARIMDAFKRMKEKKYEEFQRVCSSLDDAIKRDEKYKAEKVQASSALRQSPVPMAIESVPEEVHVASSVNPYDDWAKGLGGAAPQSSDSDGGAVPLGAPRKRRGHSRQLSMGEMMHVAGIQDAIHQAEVAISELLYGEESERANSFEQLHTVVSGKAQELENKHKKARWKAIAGAFTTFVGFVLYLQNQVRCQQ